MTNLELKSWRERLGMTQRQAAAQLGMTQSAYCSLELAKSYNTGQPRLIDRRTELATQAVEHSLRKRLTSRRAVDAAS